MTSTTAKSQLAKAESPWDLDYYLSIEKAWHGDTVSHSTNYNAKLMHIFRLLKLSDILSLPSSV